MKKILQKSLCRLQALLLLTVMFVAGSSAVWAQDATIVTSSSTSNNGVTISGGTGYYYGYGYVVQNADYTTISSDKTIVKFILHENSNYRSGGSWNVTPAGTTSYSGLDFTWEGSANSISIKNPYSGYYGIDRIDVWFDNGGGGDAPATVNSTLNFANTAWNLSVNGDSSTPTSGCHFDTRDVFTNADGVTMTLTNVASRGEGGLDSERKGTGYAQSWPNECFYSQYSTGYLALYLCNGEGFTINAPSGYNLSNIVVNRASTSYSMTSLIIDGVQNNDGTKGTWTGEAESVEFSTISGDATKRILISNIQVTLTPLAEEGEITYTIDLVDAPTGAYVTLDGQNFDSNNTYTVEKSLGTSDLEAYEPEGYYADVEYTRVNHTYTVTYKAYNYYDVTVTGTTDRDAGVVYNEQTYGNGSRIESKDVLTLASVKAADVSGYAGTVSMRGNTYTVDYQEKLDYVIATNTGNTTISKDGFTITCPSTYTGKCLNLWSTSKLTVTSSTLPIERIELEEYASKTITATSSPEGYQGNNVWVGTPTNSVVFTATNGGDFCIKSVHIYLYKPQSIDYTIDLVDAPAGASVRVNDDQDFDADGTYTTTDILDENSVSVTCPDTHYYDVAYNEGYFTVTFAAYNVYAVTVNGPAEGGVVYDKNNFTTEVKSKVVLSVSDVQPIEIAGYEAEVEFDGTNFIVTYTALPALAISSSATDHEGNYWTSFCFNKPVEFAEGFTPCIVTGTENGKLTVEEFVVNKTPVTEVIDFTENKSSTTFTVYGGLITIETQGWILDNGYGYAESPDDNSVFTVTLDESVNGVIKSVSAKSFGNQDVSFYYNNMWTTNMQVNGKTVTLLNNMAYMTEFTIELEVSDPAPIIPANTAVLLKSDAPGAVTYYTRPAGNVDVSANILQASGETGFSVSNDADHLYYKLTLNAASEAGSAGFYWDANGSEGHSINVPAHKAYLMLDASAASNRAAYIFGGDDTVTAIEGINAEVDNTPVFNLQGQRVNANKAGIYVKNGKKFIVK